MPWKQFYTEIEIITIKGISLIFNKLITKQLLIKSFFPFDQYPSQHLFPCPTLSFWLQIQQKYFILCISLIFNKLITEELLTKSFFPLINILPNIYFLVPPCPSDYKYSKNILYNISL